MAENDFLYAPGVGEYRGLEFLAKIGAAAEGIRKFRGEPTPRDPLSKQKDVLDIMLKMRQLEGPGEREKFELEERKFEYQIKQGEEQKRLERSKMVLSTFSELAKTSSPAMKRVLAENFSSFWHTMSPEEQAATKMIFDHSPMNPAAQKGAWFDESFPAPRVTAKLKDDPYAYAVQMFNQEEWAGRREHFMTGSAPPQRRMLGLGDGLYGVKDSEGKISVMNTEDMRLEQIAKEHGLAPGQLLANQGFVYGPEREISIQGNTFKTRSKFDALRGVPLGSESYPVGRGGVEAQAPGVEKLKDFAVAFASKDDSEKGDGSKLYKAVKGMLDEGKGHDWVIENMLKPMFPGWNFSFLDKGKFANQWWKFGIFDSYSQGDTEVVTFWRGQPIGLPTSDGRQLLYYYDHASGKVMDSDGRVLSTDLPSFSAKIGSMTRAQVVNEAKGIRP